MSQADVEVMEWTTGDWVRVLVHGKVVVDGHDLGTCDLMDVLKALGHKVKRTTVNEDPEDDDFDPTL